MQAEKHKARLLSQLTEIEKRVNFVTAGSNSPRQPTTGGHHHHTTVFDGGVCQACERNGGGSYGPNVPNEHKIPGQHHLHRDSDLD